MPDLYHISDKAYEHLVELAIEHNFVRGGSLRRAGMSRFIERLAFRTFVDTRPDEYRAADEARMSRFRCPIWVDGSIRRMRTLDLSDEALSQYCAKALELNITLGRYYRGGPWWKSPTSITATMLEAIGLGWLTPTRIPVELGPAKTPMPSGASGGMK